MLVYDWNGDEELGIPQTRIIVMRGTHSVDEWEGNFDFDERTGDQLGIGIKGYFHKNFGETGKKIWNKAKGDIENCGKPVIITGHSRGAALAEILHIIVKKNKPNLFNQTQNYLIYLEIFFQLITKKILVNLRKV